MCACVLAALEGWKKEIYCIKETDSVKKEIKLKHSPIVFMFPRP
jgi:hypothetical protein